MFASLSHYTKGEGGICMAMSVLLVLMMGISILWAATHGTVDAMSAALLTGAGQAVTLALSMAGTICLWCGVVEVMRRAGLLEKLSRLLRGPIGFLFPEARKDTALRGDLAAMISANLLGLGNAATPLSIKACTRLHEISGGSGTASDSVCLLVVLGACSMQLIPATVAAVRAGAGASAPFDILPAVLVTTASGCVTGILSARLLARVWGEAP